MKIRPIIFVQSQGPVSGYGVADFSKIEDVRDLGASISPPYLILAITPSEDGEHIARVSAVYNDGEEEIMATLDSEIGNLQSFLNSDILREGSIPEKLQQYLSLFEERDVRGMALRSLMDTSGFIRDPAATSQQMALDAFVVGVAGYMASLKFLLEDRVYSELPFSFTLPFHTVDENVLNANTFKYMCHPSTAITTHSQYSKGRVLMDQILRFCNEWSPLFDDGPERDMNTAVIDTVSGYCKLSVTEMSEFQREMLSIQDEMANIQSLLESGEMLRDIKEEMDEVKREMKEEVRAEFENVSVDVESRINVILEEKLESFREEISSIFAEAKAEAFRELKLSSSELEEAAPRRRKRNKSKRHYHRS